MDTIEIDCPDCKAKLVINRDTGKIIQHKAFKKSPVEFTSFLDKQKKRKQDLAEKFEASKKASKTRLQSIQDKIDYRKENMDETDDPKPKNWD